MDGSFIKTPEEFELGSVFLYSKNKKTFKLEVDCFLTSLLFSYNNKDKIIPIILNDFPLLQYRERIVWNIELKDLKELFNSYIESIQEKNIYFDPCLLKPDIFIEPKITYLTEIIKQSCFMGKKIIAIVDINCAELIADIWKSESNLDEIINLQKILKTSNKKKMSMSFSDYIEKHVMLDIMFDNFVQENFIAYKNFPFDAEGTLGKEIHMNNLFMIWNHFHRKYKLKYGDVKHFDEKIDILDNKIQPDDMEPEDFDDKLQK